MKLLVDVSTYHYSTCHSFNLLVYESNVRYDCNALGVRRRYRYQYRYVLPLLLLLLSFNFLSFFPNADVFFPRDVRRDVEKRTNQFRTGGSLAASWRRLQVGDRGGYVYSCIYVFLHSCKYTYIYMLMYRCAHVFTHVHIYISMK